MITISDVEEINSGRVGLCAAAAARKGAALLGRIKEVKSKFAPPTFDLPIHTTMYYRPVASGGAGGASVFGKIVNPISTKGDILCPPQYYEPPGFSDLATGLNCTMCN